MRYIARSYAMLGQKQQAKNWYLKAVAEAPHLREPYVDLAMYLYGEAEWEGVAYFTACALRIRQRPRSYICEAQAWGSLPHDLRSIALYRTGRVAEALKEAKKARAIEPGNERLCRNVTLMEEELSPPPPG